MNVNQRDLERRRQEQRADNTLNVMRVLLLVVLVVGFIDIAMQPSPYTSVPCTVAPNPYVHVPPDHVLVSIANQTMYVDCRFKPLLESLVVGDQLTCKCLKASCSIDVLATLESRNK
jgi:hypothetical protein